MPTAGALAFCSFDEPHIKLTAYAWQGDLEDDSQHPNMGLDLYAVSGATRGRPILLSGRITLFAAAWTAQPFCATCRGSPSALCFFLIEELVAEDDQLVIVDEPHHSLSALGCGFSYHRRALVQGRTHLLHARPS